jgi:xanthine dehydrogenase YagS FAD-binding subunit
MNRFEWVQATSIEAALAQLAEGATAKAGGVDLLDRMKEGIEAPTRIVNIRTIPGLDRIEAEAKGLKIGPLVTLTQLAESAVIRKTWPALAEAAFKAATPQIRNMASVGGNLLQRPRCWYFRSSEFHCLKKGGDQCYAIPGENQYHAIFDNDVCAIVHPSAAAIPLMAYGATLEITSAKGKREQPLESFFVHPREDVLRENSLGAGEMITAIRVPLPKGGTKAAYLKQGEKESFDWPLADVAAVIEMSGAAVRKASIILGAAAAVPRRATGAEKYLAGKRLDETTAREAGRIATEGATPLSGNGYKVALFQAVIARALMGAA